MGEKTDEKAEKGGTRGGEQSHSNRTSCALFQAQIS